MARSQGSWGSSAEQRDAQLLVAPAPVRAPRDGEEAWSSVIARTRGLLPAWVCSQAPAGTVLIDCQASRSRCPERGEKTSSRSRGSSLMNADVPSSSHTGLLSPRSPGRAPWTRSAPARSLAIMIADGTSSSGTSSSSSRNRRLWARSTTDVAGSLERRVRKMRSRCLVRTSVSARSNGRASSHGAPEPWSATTRRRPSTIALRTSGCTSWSGCTSTPTALQTHERCCSALKISAQRSMLTEQCRRVRDEFVFTYGRYRHPRPTPNGVRYCPDRHYTHWL